MIKYFKVRNFRSIKETITVNFLATKRDELKKSNVHSKGEDRLLKGLLLYGDNGSGKTNILEAFVTFRSIILNSDTSTSQHPLNDIIPFKLDVKAAQEPSCFEIGFYVGRTKYRYGFECTSQAILKEWLLETKRKQETAVFLRIKEDVQIHSNILEAKDQIKITNKLLFLSQNAKEGKSKLQYLQNWFRKVQITSTPFENNNFDGISRMVNNPDNLFILGKILQQIDPSISGVEVDSSENERLEVNQVVLIRDQYNHNQKKTGKVSFTLAQESTGIQKCFQIVIAFLQGIRDDNLLIIDGMDAYLHSLVTKALISVANSTSIKSDFQLLASVQDTALLDKRVLRRDQIYFLEKDHLGATQLTALISYKPRKNNQYDRNYLNGKYGAIPLIEDVETLFQKF